MERLERTPIEAEPDFGIATAGHIGTAAWLEADARRTAYRRSDTKEIPRKMLKPDVPLTMDDIYAMLNVYYWWNEEWLAPVDYLDDLLGDLDKKSFKQAVRMLHQNFSNYCNIHLGENPATHKPCQRDGWECFKELVGVDGVLREDYAETVTMLLLGIDDDEDGPLVEGLRTYNRRKLTEAGCDELEAAYSDVLFEIEEDRRDEANRYGDILDMLNAANSSAEEARTLLHSLLMETLSDKASFRNIVEDYEDIPNDWEEWDSSKKRALVKRWLESNRELIDLLIQTYEQEKYGIKPSYLYKARPSYTFPGEV